jgi:hypothetical protein
MINSNSRESLSKRFVELLGEKASKVSKEENKQKEYIMGYIETVLSTITDSRVLDSLCNVLEKDLNKTKPFDVWIRKTSKQDWMHYSKTNTLDEAINVLRDISLKKPKYVDNLFGRVVQGEYVVMQENL